MDANRLAEAPEYRATARAILSHVRDGVLARPDQRLTIGIAGETGSGKTVTAVAIAQELRARGWEVVVLHQDDYFRLPPRQNHEQRRRTLAHVGPREVDMQRLQQHVAAFRAGRSNVPAPQVDYAADQFRETLLDFSRAGVLLVEGTYVLQLDDLDIRVFLSASYEDTRADRARRARDIDEPFVEDVLRIEHDIVQRQVTTAHIVVDREFTVTPRIP